MRVLIFGRQGKYLRKKRPVSLSLLLPEMAILSGV
jgi:hypothetical protein